MAEFSFPFETTVEEIRLGDLTLAVERLKSIDETIDAFFAEYERTNRAELFEGLCPYFGVPWPAGLALARIMAKEAPRWRGQEVLELGCGLALPSFVLARAGAMVTATDLHPDVPVFLERNRARNGGLGPEYLFLDWREGRSLPPARLVIGSDIVYDRAQAAELHRFLRAFPHWEEAVFTDPGRPYWDSFLALVSGEAWNAEQALMDGIFVLRLTR